MNGNDHADDSGSCHALLAPCGMSCVTCTACGEGTVGALASEMLKYLEGFGPYAAGFAQIIPVYEGYAQFESVLKHLAKASCEGCRSGHGPMKDCPFPPCVKEKGLVSCAECDSFPCDRADRFPSFFREKWIRNVTRLHEIGMDAYWREINGKSHYV